MSLRLFSILFSTTFCCLQLAAQDVVFVTQMSAEKIGVEDAVQVRYEIQNVQGVDQFALASLKDFDIVGGPSQGQNISMIDGEVSMSISVTYAFKPKRTGTLTLPQALAKVRGKSYRSKEKSIEVVQGSMQPQQVQRRRRDPLEELFNQQRRMAQRQRQMMQQRQRSTNRPRSNQQQPQSLQSKTKVNKDNIDQNIFIKVDVDKQDVKVGEQIMASYKLYTRIPMEVNLTKLPDLNNFWSQDFDIPSPPKPRREVLDGVEYQVFTIKKSALFPTQAGQLSLDPAEGEGMARIIKEVQVKRRNPLADIFDDDPFFNNAFGSLLMNDPMFNDGFFNTYEYEDVPVSLRSKPVVINVSAADTVGQPAHYKGAVGRFKLESKINAMEMTTDDVATLTLTIRGNGNIKLISPPDIALAEGVEMFDPIEDDSITSKANNRISGYKTIKYRFTPNASGPLKVPSVDFSYYDPVSKSYETLSTPEYTLTVKPGKTPIATNKNLPSDIHDISDEKSRLFRESHSLLPNKIWYWGAYVVPSLAFLLLIGFQRRREEERTNVVAFKNKRANKVALKRLSIAEQHLKSGEQMKFYEEISKAVWLYMSDKLTIPLASLSKEMAASLLQQKGADQALIDEAFLITDECELALYTPDSGNLKMNQIYSDSLKLIGRLEECIA